MKLLVISGGRHPYEESTPVLVDFLTAAGHDVTMTEDASVLADSSSMNGYDALVFNTRRENVPDFGELALAKDEQVGMSEFVRSGKGFICIPHRNVLVGNLARISRNHRRRMDIRDELPSALRRIYGYRERRRPRGC